MCYNWINLEKYAEWKNPDIKDGMCYITQLMKYLEKTTL